MNRDMNLESREIKILDDALISQIAAGEVVERPASVVKELVENSVDAGARMIAVEIEEGGMRKIRVVDDGSGVRPDEVRLAFERHATSKIARVEDLFSIGSLGFRGEALASIASVARVVMRSRHADERVGRRLEIDGGREVDFGEEACETGTDISVFGLFHHTPARKKYMKTERTEYGRIFDLLCGIALAHPAVGFRLKRDGTQVFDLPADQSLKERVRVLYGGETADALIPVTYHQSNLVINGFVGKPELARSSRKYQFLFVNGRAIESRAVAHAVKEAFHSLLMHEKQPWYLLDVQMDPQFVDVNVHPRKLEVRFLNQREVYKAVMGSVHHALEGSMLGPVAEAASGRSVSGEIRPGEVVSFGGFAGSNLGPALNLQAKNYKFEKRDSQLLSNEAARQRRVFDVQGTVLRPVAQIAASYIVAESEDGMVLIDQHAAHERVRYARLMEALENEDVVSQKLLTPLELDLGVDGARIVEENLADFVALGFEIEAFGDAGGRGATFLLRAVPAGIERRDPEQVLREIIADLTNDLGAGRSAVKNLREFLLTYTACRGAVKFGDKLTMAEMEGLIADMEKTKHCSHCPHGRPAIVKLTFDKLEEMFKRKNF
jgi:DNA mismatch repair protein MutL